MTLVSEYSSGVNETAKERAEFYAREQATLVSEKIDSAKRETEFIATKASAAQTSEQFERELRDAAATADEQEYFLDLFYYKDGKVYEKNGTQAERYVEISDVISATETTLSKAFQFKNRVMTIAIASPIESSFADGVIAAYDRKIVSLSSAAQEIESTEKSEFILLCKSDGRVVDKIVNSNEFEVSPEPVGDAFLKELTDDSETLSKISAALNGDGIETFLFKKGSENYALCAAAFGATSGNISLLCGYKVSEIYGEGFAIAQSIFAAVLGLSVVMAIILFAAIIAGFRSSRKIYELEMVVPFLNCATRKKFKKKADEILKRRSTSSFAFVSMRVENLGYVVEQFGEEASKKLTKYVADAIRGAIRSEETFGYVGEGEFFLLVHYRGKQAFTERLNGLYLRIASFGEFGENYKVGVSFAAYVVEKDVKQTVAQALDKLNMATERAPERNALYSLAFYDADIRRDYMKKAEIESKMEQALKNSEFHLFYQPKYNLQKKKPDGCEILVRWYDPELKRYHLPSEFLPVFEENGFIKKIDRFVFYKACENLARRAESRKVSYPVSVNVSRITAIRDDFVEYYSRIKSKFGIKDNFITLEFTESFAYENYEFLQDIVGRLRANGFLCSIDDFGTGYSSYNILKTIQMDEIKLDKFFLSKGFSPERDQTLLSSVIEMVKKLGMKATQEGVETKEDLYRLEQLGCDVIQGFYFAKPMKYSDYCEFIDQNFA